MLDRIKTALTRKIGPLPAGIWLAILGVAVYLYRRHNATTTATAPTATTAPPYSSAPTAALAPGSGGGGYSSSQPSSGNQGGAPAIYDPLTGQQLPPTSDYPAPVTSTPTAPTSDLVYGYPPQPTSSGGGGFNPGGPEVLAPGPSTTTTPRPHPNASATARLSQPYTGGHVVQESLPGGGYTDVTVAQPLLWGGTKKKPKQFTDQASFDKWARQHGTTAQAILAHHPAAATIYRNLPVTAPVTPAPKRASQVRVTNPVAKAAQEVARSRAAAPVQTTARARSTAPAPAAPKPAAAKPRTASLPVAVKKTVAQVRRSPMPSQAQVQTIARATPGHLEAL